MTGQDGDDDGDDDYDDVVGNGRPGSLAATRPDSASLHDRHDERGPALSTEGLSLYFTSDRPGGMRGNDIWVSQRASREDPWDEPVNLGPTVNTASNEGVPSFSRDGHFMYFNSRRPGGFGGADIWIVRRARCVPSGHAGSNRL